MCSQYAMKSPVSYCMFEVRQKACRRNLSDLGRISELPLCLQLLILDPMALNLVHRQKSDCCLQNVVVHASMLRSPFHMFS
jgi:hypothetical protein